MSKKIIICFLLVMISLSVIDCFGDETHKLKVNSITTEEAKKIIDQEKGIIILDVRDQIEYDQGHISRSILIPLSELQNKAEENLKNKNQKILVYCRSGNKSAKAADILKDMGYENIYDFGGINSWSYEVEK